MKEKSILDLTDKELEQQFGERISFEGLAANIQKYQDEINSLISEKKIFKLRTLLKKLFNLDSSLHKGNIWRAFGDTKGAMYQYRKVEKLDPGYNEAQYQLIQLIVQSETDANKCLYDMIACFENIDYEASQYGYASIFIGEFLYKINREQEALIWYKKATNEFCPESVLAKHLISILAGEIEEVSLEGGRMKLKKGEHFEIIHLQLDTIYNLKSPYDRCGTDGATMDYVISLSHNENGAQGGKFSFFCIPYNTIDNSKDVKGYDGIYAGLEDLSECITPIHSRFEGVNDKGELVFHEISNNKNGNIFAIAIEEAEKSIRVDEEGQDYIVWEEKDHEVIAVRYGENHPKTLQKKMKRMPQGSGLYQRYRAF